MILEELIQLIFYSIIWFFIAIFAVVFLMWAFLDVKKKLEPIFENVMEIVYEARLEQEHEGKERKVYDMSMTVQPGAFVIGKETRDVLWPPECTVLAVHHTAGHRSHGELAGMHAGDVLDLHFASYDLERTMYMLTDLIGTQPQAEN
jgi:hypothetical protein